jgi:UDP-glucose-4-epimerase GalE
VNAVLVTGGAGYIGSHAVKALVEAGQPVVVYDNLSAGHREAAARAGGAQTRFVEGDVLDTERLLETIRAHGVEAVMHFAACLSVGESVRNPAAYYRNNVLGSLSVLDAMLAGGAKHLVFSSTAAVFGNPLATPITEDHPTHPINPYGDTKLAVERALGHYARAYGLHSIALRYFNAAGADPDGVLGEDHAPEGHVIPRAIDAALGRDSFEVFGEDYDTPDGTCLRDYVHVTDLAAAHLAALNGLRAGAATTVYNLGNGRPTSVRAILDSVERVTRRKVPYTAGPRREGDPAILFASSERIRRELGWSPQYEDLDTIVETAWRWRERHPEGYSAKVNV